MLLMLLDIRLSTRSYLFIDSFNKKDGKLTQDNMFGIMEIA